MKRLAAIILTPILFILLATGVNIALGSEDKPTPVQPPATNPYINTRPTINEMVSTITPDTLYVAINKERVANNLTPYTHSDPLDASSEAKCTDMVKNNYYGHGNPQTGKRGYEYAGEHYGYHNGVSENLNEGYFKNADDVVQSWMNSPSHRDSILSTQFTEIGFAVCVKASTPNELTVVQHKLAKL